MKMKSNRRDMNPNQGLAPMSLILMTLQLVDFNTITIIFQRKKPRSLRISTNNNNLVPMKMKGPANLQGKKRTFIFETCQDSKHPQIGNNIYQDIGVEYFRDEIEHILGEIVYPTSYVIRREIRQILVCHDAFFLYFGSEMQSISTLLKISEHLLHPVNPRNPRPPPPQEPQNPTLDAPNTFKTAAAAF